MECRWISVQAAAEYLSVHPKTIRRLCDCGQIPATKIGGNVRIDLKKLEAILEEREQELSR